MPKIPKKIDSLYIHFPYCRHLCNYCDFYKTVPSDITKDVQQFHSYLERSYLIHQSLIEKHGYSWSPLKTIYIGGGTPSLWGQDGSRFLQDFFRKHQIQMASDCEFTLEVNPGGWSEEGLQSWQEIGANRFSLGVQSLNKDMIQFLDRVHTVSDVYDTLNYFHKNKLNFSMDFMLGLPSSQNYKRDVLGELKQALVYQPSHFSVYILTVKENYKYYKDLPAEEWIETEFLQVSDFLIDHGYLHYEVSNFALKGKQSAHNLNYWKSQTVAALGPSATGFLSEERLRYKWTPLNPETSLEYLTEDEFRLERIYMSLRSEEGLNINEFPEKISSLIEKWSLNQLIIKKNDKIYLTSRGYLLIDSLMNDLFSFKLL
jgi:oxygen-independent coproporphyrinogen-3 oxidase